MKSDATLQAAQSERPRCCPACGTPYPGQSDELGCPVCMLRRVLEPGAEGEEPGLPGYAPSRPDEGRFDHYELAQREDGAFDELGRGAMGVTYRAIDTVLGHAVALKVIDARIAGRPDARKRFLREARAAARLRHPNVASVFYYGVRKSDGQCFYAMELIEGETLEARVRRDGPLPAPVALEIVSQVARAMAAAEAQGLVHRDLKPANLMLTHGPELTVKVIDFGLAKVAAAADQTDLTQAGFVGTPAFASPEQFSGAGVDVRSDLYSLGVTLWVILTGKAPFRGSWPEVMHQKLHAPLPLEQLKGLPQPAVALLQTLLEKDPARRFQNPAKLLEVMPTITGAMEARRPIKHQKLWTTFVLSSRSRQKKLSVIRTPEKSIAVLPFDSLSDNKSDTYFADGVQDEILSNLAKVSQLKVISRTSVMTYRPSRNRDLRSIAGALRVANLVEGTVRRDGNRIRITIRLVDARTDGALWSESYDRDLTDIFAIQSEIAHAVASKLRVSLSSEEKKWIEAKPTSSLEAYDLYLLAKELFLRVRLSMSLGNVEKPLVDAIGFLEQALQLDPKFTLAYCASTHAHDNLFFLYDSTQERRAFADAAVNSALGLQPDLPEVRLAYASHLYLVYRDYEWARVQLAVARCGLPNDAEAIALGARIDRRQGQFEKAISEFNESVTRDPNNIVYIQELADTLWYTRQFRAAEQAFDRVIDLRSDLPILKVRKSLYVTFYETGDDTAVRSAIMALPAWMSGDSGVLSLRLKFALVDRDWSEVRELIEKTKGSEDGGWFAYGDCPVPAGCYSILLARLQGEQPGSKSIFAETRQQLTQKIQKSAGNVVNACLLSDLAVVDALLGPKEAAIAEAKRAMEMLSMSEDVFAGLGIAMNLAVVYAWTDEFDLAFATLSPLVKTPFGIFYGQLKCDPYWELVRKDPRFEKLLAQLAQNQSRQHVPSGASLVRKYKPSVRSAPKKISVARLPVTGSEVFGRDEDIVFLDNAWANPQINVVTIVAWAGVGKSTLVNHWLRRMAAKQYRSAELVFGWSFYRQGSSGGTSSADEFLDAALTWFGDPDPRLGTGWEKGERLAKLVSHRRTLLVLDGLEPLQNPPGPQEGRLREPSLQALLRELAAFNTGLCVVTTRMPIADIADHEHTSAPRRDLEHLSGDAGAKLLRALDVKGHESELRSASEEFSGHCLALTLLGSYLTDAFNGDIRCRTEVSARLANDVRQGAHARKVMESYQTWFGDGPELSVLRMLGLFDRPAAEKALGALLKPPAICGLTESLTNLSSAEWRTLLARLRRARLLAAEDPHNPGYLDTHPLVREYFGDQIRSQRTEAWMECNRRLYTYYRTLVPEMPNSFVEMEPLFLAVICACNTGLFREALHDVYIPRIQRGNVSFAANVLGARGPLLLVLAHFFEPGRWVSPLAIGVEGHNLTAEDQLFLLMQAALYLTSIRGFSAPEASICYERAESLCHLLNRPVLLYSALMGQWRYSLSTDKLSATVQIAKRVYSLAQKQNDAALTLGAYRSLAATLYHMGDFETAGEYARHGVQIWRSGSVQYQIEEIIAPAVACLCYEALSEWHFGDIISCHATMAKALSLATDLHDMQALVLAHFWSAWLAHFGSNPAEVRRLASDVIELSLRQNFASWPPVGVVLSGWARSASGNTAEGISWIEDGISDYRVNGSVLTLPFLLTLKAEALHLADRTSEALEAIKEAEALVERFQRRVWCVELHRLRGVFLTTIGGDEVQIEASFCEAIRIAKQQKSVSLGTRAEATYAEYCRQKAIAPRGGGFRLSLC